MRWLYIFATALAMSMTWLFGGLAVFRWMFNFSPDGECLLPAFFVLFLVGWWLGVRVFPRTASGGADSLSSIGQNRKFSMLRKYLLLPDDCSVDPTQFATTSSFTLGGVFYDYLRDSTGRIVGLRYWLMDSVIFSEHPVYSNFLGDHRFIFTNKKFVDLVFEFKDANLLNHGELTLDIVQDFGGDTVLRYGKQFAIEFELGFV